VNEKVVVVEGQEVSMKKEEMDCFLSLSFELWRFLYISTFYFDDNLEKNLLFSIEPRCLFLLRKLKLGEARERGNTGGAEVVGQNRSKASEEEKSQFDFNNLRIPLLVRISPGRRASCRCCS